MQQFDSIIIGAGLSGLAAGIRLSYYNYRVAIIESHHRTGGLNSYYYRDGRVIDTGLHAITNYAPGVKSSPLGKLLRQLKLKPADLKLSPQLGSQILFGSGADTLTIDFNNKFDSLASEIKQKFSDQFAGFERLHNYIQSFDELNLTRPYISARKIISKYLNDPLLIDMLLCPLMYYGSAIEQDMDFSQFAIMYRAIYLEGFARPADGVKPLLELLKNRFISQGGELMLNCRVKKILIDSHQQAIGVELEDGRQLHSEVIFSSAGAPNTWNLAEAGSAGSKDCSESISSKPPPGGLSFVELILYLDQLPSELGFKHSIIFFNSFREIQSRHKTVFFYGNQRQLYDSSSGVICCPENFDYSEFSAPASSSASAAAAAAAAAEDRRLIRLTLQADYDQWNKLSPQEYTQAKQQLKADGLKILEQHLSGISSKVLFYDAFTPLTVQRYTSHPRGAVYGSKVKFRSGLTPWKNLYLIGTDQGFLGIIGAMLSGISIANQFGLK